ncbi:MAG: proton-conducting transporter membrane subunit [Anaerolineales bacterium]|jgi:NADH:ubiquinone oxidoreductase subunit 2 (subunit N)|nr:proton-conducting transporter membrane subunit [Anaerolineales bacterium]
MSAPVIWIGLPLALGVLLLLIPRERLVAWLGGLIAAGLALLALLVPTDTALNVFGLFSLRIDATLSLLGRQISLTPAAQIVLVLAYALGAFWFFGALAVGGARRLIPIGMVTIALLTASLAIRPFLYAAILIQGAVLLAVFMLAEPGKPAGRGLIRFLIYQTLAMPFILFAGFLLSGVEAGPRDLAAISQAAILLGLGFAFLLSIFPLSSWLPMLAEETAPYVVGFVFSIFPTFALLLALNFVDRYSWIRESEEFFGVLLSVGLLTAFSGGLWAAFQRHAGRLFGYAAVAELGISLLALSLPDRALGLQIVFSMIIPRALAYGVLAISLAVFQEAAGSLRYQSLQGLARHFPVATLGIFLSILSLSGVPLLAGFPVRQVLWQELSALGVGPALWLGLTSLGLWIAALRILATLTMAPENTEWESREAPLQRTMISIGLAALFLSGLFPQWAAPLLTNLPGLFSQISR